jgi:hypothetical protein
LRCCLELIGKLTGEIKAATTNVSIKAQFGIEQLSIRDLSDAQLEELIQLIQAREGAAGEPDLPLIEATLPPPAKSETWKRHDAMMAQMRSR